VKLPVHWCVCVCVSAVGAVVITPAEHWVAAGLFAFRCSSHVTVESGWRPSVIPGLVCLTHRAQWYVTLPSGTYHQHCTVIHRVRKTRTYSFPWITLTNLNVFLQFLAHIIPMIRFTKGCKICFRNLRIRLRIRYLGRLSVVRGPVCHAHSARWHDTFPPVTYLYFHNMLLYCHTCTQLVVCIVSMVAKCSCSSDVWELIARWAQNSIRGFIERSVLHKFTFYLFIDDDLKQMYLWEVVYCQCFEPVGWSGRRLVMSGWVWMENGNEARKWPLSWTLRCLWLIHQDLVDDVRVLEADMTKLKCHAERLLSARHPATAIVQVRLVTHTQLFGTYHHHVPVSVVTLKLNCLAGPVTLALMIALL